MKQLDVVTLRALGQTIQSMCWHEFVREADLLSDLLDRSGVKTSPELSQAVHRMHFPTLGVVEALNGSGDLERLLLRVASPKEHAGNRRSIEKVVQELNQALWPEALKIEFVGVEPQLTEIIEPRMIQIPRLIRRQEQAAEPTATQAKPSDEIFVIHGRDLGTKDTVVRLLRELGLEPVVLQELPNRGRTIIEKFEDYAKVQFAVAIFSPDDQGALSDDIEHLRPRSRQNVIFEFGYFIGKLGRNRTCALIKGDVEIPSDYSGVLYIQMDDSDGWKFKLVQELQSAGYEADANVLTRR